jgi:hypothetical protein
MTDYTTSKKTIYSFESDTITFFKGTPIDHDIKREFITPEELSRLEKLVKTDIEIIEQDIDTSKFTTGQHEVLDNYHIIDKALLNKLEKIKE